MALGAAHGQNTHSGTNFPAEIKAWMLSSRATDAFAVGNQWLSFAQNQGQDPLLYAQVADLFKRMPGLGFKSGRYPYLFFRTFAQFKPDQSDLKQRFLGLVKTFMEAKDLGNMTRLLEHMDLWLYQQGLPAQGFVRIQVQGPLELRYDAPSKAIAAQASVQDSLDAASWDGPSESVLPAEEAWLKPQFKPEGLRMVWSPAKILLVMGKDSLRMDCQSFEWSTAQKVARAQQLQIPGSALFRPSAAWSLEEAEFWPKSGQWLGLKSQWQEGELSLSGQGKMGLKRKQGARVYPFEFRSSQPLPKPLEGKYWQANGRLLLLNGRQGLAAQGQQKAHIRFFNGKQTLAEFQSEVLWMDAKESIQIPQARFISPMANKDSLYHPALRVAWEPELGLLKLRRLEGKNQERILYEDSYHQVRIAADLGQLNVPEMRLDFFRVAGKNEVPAWIESFDYFEEARIRQVQGILPFNPLRILYNAVIEQKKNKVYLADIADKYQQDIQLLRPGFYRYKESGYLQVEGPEEALSLTRLGRHYARVMFEKKDFDRFYVASLGTLLPSDSASISIQLKDASLRIRGVETVNISDSLQANILPSDRALVFSKGRNFDFKGEIQIGNYRFRGPDFKFNYDQFLVEFPRIDSITFLPRLSSGGFGNKELGAQFKYESGTLYLSPPNNKSGRFGLKAYPKLSIPKGLTAYFNEPWRAQGVYPADRFYFKVPFIEMDSLLEKDLTFEGRFYSDGVLPVLNTQLLLMPDQSFGFQYQSKQALALYQNQGRWQPNGPVLMDKKGLHGAGVLVAMGWQADASEAQIFPDSLRANARQGKTLPGPKLDLPEVQVGPHALLWKRLEDSLLLNPGKRAFALYGASHTLFGRAWLHRQQWQAQGQLNVEEAQMRSDGMRFYAKKYMLSSAEIRVGKGLPSFMGSEIDLSGDVPARTLKLSPEPSLGAERRLALPRIRYQANLSQGLWDLNKKILTLNSKQGFELEPLPDSTQSDTLLAATGRIHAKTASYDLVQEQLQLSGVQEVRIGPSKVYPQKGVFAIQRGGRFRPFSGARAHLDAENERHLLRDLNVTEANARYFKGEGTYLLARPSGDSVGIPFRKFSFEAGPKGEALVRANATFGEKSNLALTAHQAFKGEVELNSQQEFLQFRGFIKPNLGLANFKTAWIPFEPKPNESPNLILNAQLSDEAGRAVSAGIFINGQNKLYPTFLGPMSDEADPILFQAGGKVQEGKEAFLIEGKNSRYALNLKQRQIESEGPIQLFTGNLPVQAFGSLRMSTDTLRPRLDAWLSLKFPFPPEVLKIMGDRIVQFQLDEALASASADEPEQRDAYLQRAEAVLGKPILEAIKTKMDRDHLALDKVDPLFAQSINFSKVHWEWLPNTSSFYSVGNVALVNVGPVDINAELKAYMEVVKKPNKEEFYAYLELSENLWYFFGYFDGELGLYASDNKLLGALRAHVEKNKKGDDKAIRVVEAAADEKDAFLKKFLAYYRKVAPVKKPSETPKANEAKPKPAPKPKSNKGGF